MHHFRITVILIIFCIVYFCLVSELHTLTKFPSYPPGSARPGCQNSPTCTTLATSQHSRGPFEMDAIWRLYSLISTTHCPRDDGKQWSVVMIGLPRPQRGLVVDGHWLCHLTQASPRCSPSARLPGIPTCMCSGIDPCKTLGLPCTIQTGAIRKPIKSLRFKYK